MPVVKTIKQHKLLLDTHVFIWLIEGNTTLPRTVRNSIDSLVAEESLLIAAISIWEIGMLVEKKRITLPMDVREWVERALTALQN